MKKLLLLVCLVSISATLMARPNKSADQNLEQAIQEQSEVSKQAHKKKVAEDVSNAKVVIAGESLPLYEVSYDGETELAWNVVVEYINTYLKDTKSSTRFTVTEYWDRSNSNHLEFVQINSLLSEYIGVSAQELDTPYKNLRSSQTRSLFIPSEKGTNPVYFKFLNDNDAVFAFHYPDTGRFVIIRMVYRYKFFGSTTVRGYVYETHFSKQNQEDEVSMKDKQNGLIKEMQQMELPDFYYDTYKANIK